MRLSYELMIISCIVIGMMGICYVIRPQVRIVSAQEDTTPVCKLIEEPTKYENHTVLIDATIVADEHSTVIQGPECGKGVYLSYSVGQSGEKWNALDIALAAKSSGLDKRTLRVKVRGIYHSKVQFYKRSIRQLEVIEVIDVKFEDSKLPTGGDLRTPSASTLLHESGHTDPPKPQ